MTHYSKIPRLLTGLGLPRIDPAIMRSVAGTGGGTGTGNKHPKERQQENEVSITFELLNS